MTKFVAAGLFLFLTRLAAQESRGQISGTVIDASGSAVPGATVQAKNTATGVMTSTESNAQGIYDLRFLTPGDYSIQAAASGFKGYRRPSIEVRVGDRLTLEIRLEVGSVQDAVTVTTEAPLLEAATATLGRVVDQRRVLDMPLHGGNAFALARFAPGVNNFASVNLPTELSATPVSSWIGVNGTPQQNTEFTIDGTAAMSGRAPAYSPPADMISEFKIQTATYDAGIGRTAGGAINVALKSGTNALHGSVYNTHNNAHLQSMDLFQRQFLYNPATGPLTADKRKQTFPYTRFNRYGGMISGPVLIPKLLDGRNRVFWILGYEGYRRRRNEPGTSNFTVPTLPQRTGDFSQLLLVGAAYQIYDPATIAPAPGGRFSRQPLPGNVIPASRLDRSALEYMKYWPAPNTAGTADGLNNFFRPRFSDDAFGSFNGRVDFNVTDRYRVSARHFKTAQEWTGGNQVLGNLATGHGLARDSNGGGLDQVFTLSPSLVVNARYSFSQFRPRNRPWSAGFDLRSVGLPAALVAQIPADAVMFPSITTDNYQALGTGTNSLFVSNYHVVAGDLAWTRGKHSLRIGGDYRIFREHNYNFAGGTPGFDFGTNWTRGPLDSSPGAPMGQGLASMLLGLPTGGGITVTTSSAEQSLFRSAFFQDDWRITRKLTLNLGIRWDMDSPVTERYDRSVRGFDFSSASPIEAQARANYARSPIPEVAVSQFRTTGGLTFAGVNGQPRELWNPDRNNFAPRFGFAYQWSAKTVLRGGYGLFYAPSGADRTSVNQSGYQLRTALVPSNDNGLTFRAGLTNPFPDGVLRPAGSAAGLATNVGQAVNFFNPGTINNYMQRFSFGFQRQLMSRTVLEVNYVGNRGTNLDSAEPFNALPAQYLSRTGARDQRTIDFLNAQVDSPFANLLPGTALNAARVARSQLLVPYPHFTGVNTTTQRGYSWYHSLQITVERRLSQGFTVQGNYTWSKFMVATDRLNAGDPYLEEVIDGEDRQHRATATGIYELPFGRGRPFAAKANRWVQGVIGGWDLQAIWQVNSGPPLAFGNVIYNGDLRGIALPKSERTFGRWFNTAGFDRNAASQLASNYRTFPTRLSGARGPGVHSWDISLIKRFQVTERVNFQVRGEFLNAMNRTHFGAPNTAPTSTLFGQITGTSGFPRQVHVGGRLMF